MLKINYSRLQAIQPYSIFFLGIASTCNEMGNYAKSNEVITIAIILTLLCYLITRITYKRSTAKQFSYNIIIFCLVFYTSIRNQLELIVGHLRGYQYFIIISLFFGAVFLFLNRSKKTNTHLSTYFTLVVISLFFWAAVTSTIDRISVPPLPSTRVMLPATIAHKNTPSIYFLIFDGYPRSDHLHSYFGIDNSPFVKTLEKNGFFIPRNSTSNYSSTLESVTSILNLSYLPQGASFKKNPIYGQLSYKALLDSNLVFKFLANQGYDIINLSILDIGKYNSDETHLHHFGYLSSFYSYIISRSLFGYLNAGVSRMMGYTRELKIIEVMNETIATLSSKPRFIYFHSLISHDPYYFDKQGNVVSRGWSNRNDLTSYGNQIAFANKSITYLIQQIATKDPNSITIVMSDHGFRFLDGLTDDERINESFSNFCAIRFPDGNYATLNDSISAVNVMRVVLNKAFSLNLEHLENECFPPIYE